MKPHVTQLHFALCELSGGDDDVYLSSATIEDVIDKMCQIPEGKKEQFFDALDKNANGRLEQHEIHYALRQLSQPPPKHGGEPREAHDTYMQDILRS